MGEPALQNITVAGLLEKLAERESAVEVISLSTTDGFPVEDFVRSSSSFDSDTMSAAASTIYSVSKAVAQQILAKEFKSTFIEANQGNMCFISFSVNEKDYVLAVSANHAMNLAELRISTKNLAERIKSLGV